MWWTRIGLHVDGTVNVWRSVKVNRRIKYWRRDTAKNLRCMAGRINIYSNSWHHVAALLISAILHSDINISYQWYQLFPSLISTFIVNCWYRQFETVISLNRISDIGISNFTNCEQMLNCFAIVMLIVGGFQPIERRKKTTNESEVDRRSLRGIQYLCPIETATQTAYFKITHSAWNCLQCFDAVGWAAGRASGL